MEYLGIALATIGTFLLLAWVIPRLTDPIAERRRWALLVGAFVGTPLIVVGIGIRFGFYEALIVVSVLQSAWILRYLADRYGYVKLRTDDRPLDDPAPQPPDPRPNTGIPGPRPKKRRS